VAIKRKCYQPPGARYETSPQHGLCAEQPHAYSRIFIRWHNILWLVTSNRPLYAERRECSTSRLCEILQPNFAEHSF
jgi:hypothetical protein